MTRLLLACVVALSSSSAEAQLPAHVFQQRVDGSFGRSAKQPLATESRTVAEGVLGANLRSDPGSLSEFRGRNGDALSFRVTGSTEGIVWGSEVYTDDSSLQAAAVHAGVLKVGESGVVMVTILPSRDSYTGSTRNGVTTHKYGEYPGSFRVERVPQKAKPAVSPAAKVLPDPVSLTAHRGQVGKAFLFSITGRTAVPYVGPIPEIGEPREYAAGGGNVWGSDIYTDDSTLAVAAVHAGVLQDGQTGIVKVTILPGRDSYTGSTRNGVTTHDYGAWAGSYWVEKGPEDPAVTPALPPGVNVQPDPGSLSQVRMQPLYFRVTGTTTGSVWGSDIYTDDSSLATAAVHAGALRDGETGIVKVTLAPGRNSYAGSARHGVTTREYGEYPGSFRVERALPVDDDGRRAGANSTIVLPD